MFNEWTIFQSSMLMMTFSAYIPEIETQSLMGWMMIGTIVINCLINITIIASIGSKKVYLILLKQYRIIK
jgi:hypothetical protein